MIQEQGLSRDIRIFVSIVSTLILIGLIFIYSSSSVFALERYGNAAYFLMRQLMYLAIGFGFFCCFRFVPIDWLKRKASYFFFASVGLTSLTLLPTFALRVHGSNRWFSFMGVSFQPSELLKVALFIYLGLIFARKQNRLKSFTATYLPCLMILGGVSGLLLLQPDFGSVVTIFCTAFAMFFVAEFNYNHLLITALLALPGALFLVFTKSYRLQRILVFLDPWSDPQGRGFQIIQSLIAIGSGGLWGLGIGQSKQKFFYLPMQHTDFIFSIIAEEVGFIGSFLLVILFLLLCFYGFRIVTKLQDLFAFFTSMAFVVFITLQAVINFMVALGLLPTKGLGLPFVSYGGTALIAYCCMVGLMVNFVKNNN
ncbi:putative lipid II flippase FtsW [Candidatus Dependentiae bacterium]|nr:putative lipid II flippase FtsW [Candidatus Dependentiae bacterium]